MNETKQSSLVSWSALVLFSIGTLGTVLMFMAMKETVPLEQKGLSGTMALAWKNWFGIFPALFLNAAFLFLGARLFLNGRTTTLFRNLAACTALAVALSIFFGGLSVGAGGLIGASTGQFVATKTHATLGALLGLAAMFAAVWFGWLRGPATSIARTEGDAPIARGAAAPAKPAVRPAAPRVQAAPAEEGVTAAESAALFPLDEPEIEAVAAPVPIRATPIATPPITTPLSKTQPPSAAPEPETPAATAPAAFVAPNPIPRSPYPEDVRRKGLIPPGAKPLEPAASATEAPASPSVYRWTAPGSAKDAVVEDETPAFPTASEVREVPVITRSPKTFDAIDEDEREEIGAPASLDVRAGPAHADPDAESTAQNVEHDPAAAAALPSPSWEQPVLFRPEEGDEEPVDAYGTPLTLVEKLRQARRAAGIERDDAARDDHAPIDPEMVAERAEDTLHRIEDQDLAADEMEEAELLVIRAEETDLEADLLDADLFETELPATGAREPEPAVGVAARRLDELEEFEENAEDALEDADEVDADEEDLDEAELDEEEGFRPIVRGAKVPRELDAEDGEEETADLEAADLEPAEIAATDEREFEMTAPRASSAPKFEPLTPPAIEIAAARAEPVQAGLFDAPAAAATSSTPLEKRAAEKNTAEKITAEKNTEKKAAEKRSSEPKRVEKHAAEKEVVLQPVAAVPAERSVKSSVSTPARPKLLAEVGCLFIERGRVAVSMLQRQYEMDFDEACKVLDELQEMGLIGPYLGGQRRDILLTREQWLERVEKAGAAR